MITKIEENDGIMTVYLEEEWTPLHQVRQKWR